MTADALRTAGLRAAALTLALAAAAWIAAIHAMDGMDMGVATDLGSLASFAGAWVPMMAAMMLPGAIPAVLERVHADGRARTTPLFAGSYLAVWTAVGLAAYTLYRPHGTAVAGAVLIAAGAYELTPLKRHCRRRCREPVRSGFEFGLYCVGSSIGLMAMLLALGAMSVVWMAVVALIVVGQKLLPPAPTVDVPVALAIAALGVIQLIH